MTRQHYRLDLSAAGRMHVLWPEEVTARRPERSDLEDLAVLMLEAYRGTIDYEGEGIDEAIAEVRGHFDGAPINDASTLVVVDDEVASACLVAEYGDSAIVGYVMTAPGHKGRGLGKGATVASLAALQGLGYDEVHAWITEGNTPSERIFLGLGFEVVPD